MEDSDKVYLDFPRRTTNWRNNLSLKDLSINAVFNFYARMDLNVLLDGTNMPISLPITISSNVEQDIYCKIKQVFIQWDCLGEETLISMERNGSRKNNVIRIGDVVDTGRILTKVVYIYTGDGPANRGRDRQAPTTYWSPSDPDGTGLKMRRGTSCGGKGRPVRRLVREAGRTIHPAL